MNTAYRGFTLIEVITAIVLIAIIMIPIALMAQEYVRSVGYSDFQAQAVNLARREMTIINNLNYTDPTLQNGYDNTTQNYAGYNFDLRRTVSFVPGTNNNLKLVRTRVFPQGSQEELIELDTYAMDVQFGAGSGGSVIKNDASYFLALGGVLQPDQLYDVTLNNMNAANDITMTSVLIAASGGLNLTSVTMGGDVRFAGSVRLNPGRQEQVNFQNNFLMAPDTTYSGPDAGIFALTGANPRRPLSLEIIFVFSDGSQSMPYSWTYTP